MIGGKYKAYGEYKDSGVEWFGEIPSEWKISKIKYIANLNPSKSLLKKLPGDIEVTFLPMEAIGEKGELDISRVKALKDVLSGYTYAGEGDVCIAKITPCFENGKGAVLENLMNGVAFATTEIIPFRCLDKKDAKYLYYVLTSEPFKKIAEGSMYGAGGQKRVSDNFVANYNFSLPSYRERIKIANFLDHETDKIDTLIEKQEKLIKLLKEKRQAVISHAVTKGLNPDAPMRDSGVEWLGEVPEHWEIKQFSHCAYIRNGQVNPIRYPYSKMVLYAPNHIEKETGKILFKQTAEEQGADSGKYLCLQGEVLYSKIRPALAKVVICEENKALCSADMYPIQTSNKMLNEFLYWFLLSTYYTAVVVLDCDRVAMPKINRDTIKKYKIPLPPIEEQQKIINEVVKKTTSIDKLVEKANKVIELLQERRTALISAAVTGKIDVRNWQANEHDKNNEVNAA